MQHIVQHPQPARPRIPLCRAESGAQQCSSREPLWALRSTEGSNPSPSAFVVDLQALCALLRLLSLTPVDPSRPQKRADLCSAVQRTCSAPSRGTPSDGALEVAVEEPGGLLLGAREEVAVAVERDGHGGVAEEGGEGLGVDARRRSSERRKCAGTRGGRSARGRLCA